jgi:hypothetical protein
MSQQRKAPASGHETPRTQQNSTLRADAKEWVPKGTAKTNAPRYQSLKLFPCANFFGRFAKCKYGDNCRFSHEQQVNMEFRSLQPCPNSWCKNTCASYSSQCKECHLAMINERNIVRDDRLRAIEAREPRKCGMKGCEEMTQYRYCLECHRANKKYTIDRDGGSYQGTNRQQAPSQREADPDTNNDVEEQVVTEENQE